MEPPSPGAARFRGRPLDAAPGESLVTSLARRGLPLLQRSIRYHRPRAPFCGVGACTNCLVRVNGRPNVRGCTYRPMPGDRIETENAWPSPSYDLLGALDLLFRHGLDTLHGFRRPRWATPAYHAVVRRLAGYGRAPDETPSYGPGAPLGSATDTLVIGGGRSGRSAVGRLVELGTEVTWVDAGGPTDLPPGVHLLGNARAVFLPKPEPDGDRPFQLLAHLDDGRGASIRARRVIVATGAFDGNLWFPGNDRPGVMTAEGALSIAPRTGAPPFRKAVVIGGGARAVDLIDRFGDSITAVGAPGAIDPAVVQRASARDIPLYPRSLLRGVSGRRRVRTAHLAHRGARERFDVECDALLLAHRRVPNSPLLFQAGVRMHWRSGGGAYFPVLDHDLTTSVPGVFAAGEVAGFPPGAAAEASGRAAAEASQGLAVSLEALPSRVAAAGAHELEGYYKELFAGRAAPGKLVACPCEDVLLDELRHAVRSGYRGIEVIKRYTGLGTGLCQGRYCLPDALLVLALFEGRPPEEVGYITQRPPVFPTPLSTFASLAEETPGTAA